MNGGNPKIWLQGSREELTSSNPFGGKPPGGRGGARAGWGQGEGRGLSGENRQNFWTEGVVENRGKKKTFFVDQTDRCREITEENGGKPILGNPGRKKFTTQQVTKIKKPVHEGHNATQGASRDKGNETTPFFLVWWASKDRRNPGVKGVHARTGSNEFK